MKKSILKKRVRKLIPVRKLRLLSFELTENQDKDSLYLTDYNKRLLEERFALYDQLKEIQQKIDHNEVLTVSLDDILSVLRTPQGTFLIKRIYDNKLVMFHYMRG